MGGTWLDLSSVGKGCPDGLIGYHGRTYLVEIKGPKGTLTDDQGNFIDIWRGSPVHVIRTVDGVIELMTSWGRCPAAYNATVTVGAFCCFDPFVCGKAEQRQPQDVTMIAIRLGK